MSMTLLLASLAWADRVYWSSPPTPADVDAVERTLPGATSAPLDDLLGTPPSDTEGSAIAQLQAELDAVRPLLAEFDGELQIMARLRKATADVTRLRTEDEARLLWRALCFEGNAVHRYFGDRLSTDPAAAPYRQVVGIVVLPAAWVDAVALGGVADPLAEDVPDKAQRLGYDGVRALVGAMPAAGFEVGTLAAGSVVVLDGKKIDAKPGYRASLVPGRHFFHVMSGDRTLLQGDALLLEGATMRAEAPFGPTERDALLALAGGNAAGWTVPEAALTPIRGLDEPVYLATPGKRGPTLVRVDRGQAEAIAIQRPKVESPPFAVHAAVGAGWLSSGDFFLQNVEAGAPYDETSVNAFAPSLSADVEYRTGLFAASAGVSGTLATGEYHTLPSGSSEVGTFVYPHVGVGTPWLQATVGPLFPWYLGVGAKGRVAVWNDLEFTASFVYGAGLEQAREAGEPAFEPLPLYSAWGGAGWRFD